MTLTRSRFCLNRIICPAFVLDDFFNLAKDIGISYVELRNDLPGEEILDGLPPEEVRSLAGKYGIQIVTINAIQRFNLGTGLDALYEQTGRMIDVAAAIDCKGIVLCPHNDKKDTRSAQQCFKDTVAALKKIGSLLKEAGIVGLVEPLGFGECSLRSKTVAVEAIGESGFDSFKLVHDSFHHYLGPDETVYPEKTGLVHISGVETALSKPQILDEHRVLIGAEDIMGNQTQIKALEANGYKGLYSFEPFSTQVQDMSRDKLKAALLESLELICTQ